MSSNPKPSKGSPKKGRASSLDCPALVQVPNAPRPSLERRASLLLNTVAVRNHSLPAPRLTSDGCSPTSSLQDLPLPDLLNQSMLPRLSLAPKSSRSGSSSRRISMLDTSRCRFCLTTSTPSREALIKPCQCSGPLAKIHHSCLVARLNGMDPEDSKCDLCSTSFHLQPTWHHWMATTILSKKRSLLVDFLCLVILLPGTMAALFLSISGISHVVNKKDHIKSWSTAVCVLLTMSMLTGFIVWSTRAAKRYSQSYAKYRGQFQRKAKHQQRRMIKPNRKNKRLTGIYYGGPMYFYKQPENLKYQEEIA